MSDNNELHRAFNILELMGVSRERAKSVDNGIMVLDQRHERQHESDRVRIRELEASARQVADKAIGRITELEAAIKAAMENEVSLDSERGSTWHILNDALAPQSDAD